MDCNVLICHKNGTPERIRTSDLCLRRATLYPAELRAQNLWVTVPRCLVRDGLTARCAVNAPRLCRVRLLALHGKERSAGRKQRFR